MAYTTWLTDKVVTENYLMYSVVLSGYLQFCGIFPKTVKNSERNSYVYG